LWKWILLLLGATVLAFMGYVLVSTGFDIANHFQHPSLTIIGAGLTLAIYALFRKFRKNWPAELKLSRLISHTLLGLVIGFVYMTLVVSTIDALGYADLSWSDFSWPLQWQAIMMFLAVAVGEEMIFRGVIFRMIDERWNTTVALIISALFFGFIHLPNDGATWWSSLAIAIEAGLMLAAAYKWSGTLWLPIGIHWAWNFSQGNLFGFKVSGQEAGESLLQAQIEGADWLTGGAFGAEASVVAVGAGLLASAWFIYRIYRR
jgi:membrane protease YdiL (CAAX protease family)